MKLLLLLFLVTLSLNTYSQNRVILRFNEKNASITKIMIYYQIAEIEKTSMVEVDNNTIYFNIPYAEPAYLRIQEKDSDAYFEFLAMDSTEVEVSKEIWKSKIIFGDLGLSYFKVNNYIDSINTELSSLAKRNQIIKTDSITKDFQSKYILNLQKIQDFKINYIKYNPNSFISLFFIDQIKKKLNAEEYVEYLVKNKPNLFKYRLYNKVDSYLKEKFDFESKTLIGQPFQHMNLIDKNGNKFDLKSVKSKFILLNFWGTWCGPCLNEIEEIKKISEMSDLNTITIIGIAREFGNFNFTDFSKKLLERGIYYKNFVQHDNSNLPNNTIFDFFKIKTFPTSILLQKESLLVIWKSVGSSDFKSIYKMLPN
jgi:thiol-disulfide isomerase/thioredoxin